MPVRMANGGSGMDKVLQEMFELVCGLLPSGLVILDCYGKVVFVNKQLSTLLEMDLSNFPFDKNSYSIIHNLISKTDGKHISAVPWKEKNLQVTRINLKNKQNEGYALLLEDVTQISHLSKGLQETSIYKTILEEIVQNAYEGVVVTDENGKIIMFNKAYANFLGVSTKDAVGRHVTEVIDNTRVHKVIESGIPEYRKLQKIGSHKAVVTRFPIKIDNKIKAGVGIVYHRELQDMKDLLDKLSSLENELAQMKEQYEKTQPRRYTIHHIIGNSASVLNLKHQIKKAAASNSTVLVLGENGTGKELVVHAIHNLSNRSQKPFIKINCAAIPEDILESELFGYVPGAFTGSNKNGKKGKFEAADGGTIFLDEIGDMSFHMQAKLLRFLQEREFERLGENTVRSVDVRVIAATNQNLVERIKKNQFREDLYYRLQVVQLDIPPLRKRKEDIPLLVQYFIEKFNKIFGKQVRVIRPDVMDILNQYNWPGNIRQLENVMERVFNMIESDVIMREHLPSYLIEDDSSDVEYRHIKVTDNIPARENMHDSSLHLADAREHFERQTLEEVLTKTRGNKSEAARILGITRVALYQKLRKYCL